MKHLARGLQYVHDHRTLHNDLKPANALLAKLPENRASEEDGNFARLEARAKGPAIIVTMLCDTGERYSSTDLWNPPRLG